MTSHRRLVLAAALVAASLAPLAHASNVAVERGGDGVTPDLDWTTTSFLTERLGAEARNTPSGDGRALRLRVDLNVGGASTTFVDDPLAEFADGRFAADVQVLPATATGSSPARRGLAFRVNEATMFGDGYQFVFDFDGTLVFRLFQGGAGSTLRRWDATEMPGGLAAPFSWHRLEVIARGGAFRFLYDGRELPGSPLAEATIAGPGRFGFYTFHFSSAGEFGIFDDVVAEDLAGLTLSVGTTSDYVKRGTAAGLAAFLFNGTGATQTRNFRLTFTDRAGVTTIFADRTLSLGDGARRAKELAGVTVPAVAALGPGRFRFETDGGESADVFVEVTP